MIRYLCTHWFPLLTSLIAAISCYDAFLLIRFEHCITDYEENPVGLWLIQIADGDVEVFVRAKLAGTLIVVCSLVQMYRWRVRKTFTITTSVAAYQVGLLAYLTL